MCIIKSQHLKLGVYCSKINCVSYATETSWLNGRTYFRGKKGLGPALVYSTRTQS